MMFQPHNLGPAATGVGMAHPASPYGPTSQKSADSLDLIKQRLLAGALRGGGMPNGAPMKPPMMAPARPMFPTMK